MFVVKLWEVDEPERVVARHENERHAVRLAAWHLRTTHGPLAAYFADFETLADAVSDAYGGEACITMEKE